MKKLFLNKRFPLIKTKYCRRWPKKITQKHIEDIKKSIDESFSLVDNFMHKAIMRIK